MKENTSPLNLSVYDSQLAANHAKRESFPVQEAGAIRMIKLAHKLVSDHANVLLRDYGLTQPEYSLLILLDGHSQGLSPSEISQSICEKAANTTRLIDQLMGKNLVQRMVHADDRRRWVVQITAEGEELIRQALPSISQQLQGFFGEFSATDFTQLEHLLRKLLLGLEA